MTNPKIYCGFYEDRHGITQLGRVVLDGWVFGLLPENEDCAGWELGRMQALMERIQQEWDRHGGLPGRLPPELRERHEKIYEKAMGEARRKGWDPELGEDE